ncbi:alpha/beta hydrolase, partial [Streptomyces spiralis]
MDSSISRRTVAVSLLAGATALAVPGVASAVPGRAVGRPDDADRRAVGPTVVLIHGAFADASSWNAVTARLLRQG